MCVCTFACMCVYLYITSWHSILLLTLLQMTLPPFMSTSPPTHSHAAAFPFLITLMKPLIKRSEFWKCNIYLTKVAAEIARSRRDNAGETKVSMYVYELHNTMSVMATCSRSHLFVRCMITTAQLFRQLTLPFIGQFLLPAFTAILTVQCPN